MLRFSFFFGALLFAYASNAQSTLQPGFDKEEYLELMRISVVSAKSPEYAKKHEAPKEFNMIYQSGNIGLDNSWDLWLSDDKRAVISLRGTTSDFKSWLENFYSAMIPAKGTLTLNDGQTFDYRVANNPKAAVHVGWTLGMAIQAIEIIPKIDSLHNAGIKDFLIVGHSQGGAIAYLLTAQLRYMQNIGQIASDIQFKTYCSAAPKPGNLYFAYEYEALTQDGWSYNVVNALDWVPEVPIAVQTKDDLNDVSPFTDVKGAIKKQKPLTRPVLRHVYHKLDRPARRTQANYERYLGNKAEKMVREHIPSLDVPEYINSNHYVRCGNHITLMPDEKYQSRFTDESNVFLHHLHEPYMFLVERYGK